GVMAIGPKEQREEKPWESSDRGPGSQHEPPPAWSLGRGRPVAPLVDRLRTLALMGHVVRAGVRQLALELRHDPLRQVLAGGVVDRVGEILVLAIRPLAARHGDEQARVAVDDLESPDHERVVEGDTDERLQLVVVSQGDADLGDLDHARVTSAAVPDTTGGASRVRGESWASP